MGNEETEISIYISINLTYGKRKFWPLKSECEVTGTSGELPVSGTHPFTTK